MTNKLVRIGVATIRNESIDVIGWAKMLNCFCDRIVGLYDTETNDDTLQKIKDNVPYVEIKEQDRSLGDSDENTQGELGNLIMHANKTKFIQEEIDDGEWFIEMSCDERFHPQDWNKLEIGVKYAQEHGFDALAHSVMYEPVKVSSNQLLFDKRYYLDSHKPYLPDRDIYGHCFSIDWNLQFRHSRFQEKSPHWEQNSQPHHSFQGAKFNPLVSTVPIWHYHRVKAGILPASWRDAKGSITRLLKKYNGLAPLIPLHTPFIDWENLTSFTYAALQTSFVLQAKATDQPQVNEIGNSVTKQSFELNVPQRKLRILLIGTNTMHCNTTRAYYECFRDSGLYDITWIGEGATDLDLSNIQQHQIQFNGLLGQYPILYRECSLNSILNLLGKEFDAIVHLQDNLFFTETEPSRIPYIYILNHPEFPRISPSVSIVLCASKNIMDQMKYYHDAKYPIGYLPHALSPEYYMLERSYNLALNAQREILCSFSGELYNPPSLYNERRNVMRFLKDQLKDQFNAHWMSPIQNNTRTPEIGEGRLSLKGYQTLLLHSQFGINCPTKSGFNFRDLEIPALKAILITKRNRDLDFLGFRHGYNCYFYDTPEEILDLIKEYNPQIASRGYDLVNQHTYDTRFTEIQKIIQELLK